MIAFARNLIIRDLRARNHLALPRTRRLLPVLACFGVIILTTTFGLMTKQETLGLMLFRMLLPICLLLALLVAPMAGGKMAVSEMEEGALDMLLLTGVSVPTLVVSRYLSAVVELVVMVGSLLPLLFLSVGLGGVSLVQLSMGALLVVAVAIAGCALGLLASILQGKRYPIYALGLVIGWSMILAPLLSLVPKLQPYLSVFPFGASDAILRGQLDLAVWSSILLHLAMAAGLVLISLLAILIRQRRPVGLKPGKVIQERPPLPHVPTGQNPVYWRDKMLRYGSNRNGYLLVAATMLLTILTGAMVYWINELHWAQMVQLSSLIGYWLITLILLALYAWRNLDAFTDEGPGIKEMLTLSDCRGRNIVNGKHRAILWSLLPWLLVWLGCVIIGLLSSAYLQELSSISISLLVTALVLLPPTYFAARLAAYRSLTHPGAHVSNIMIAGGAWAGSLILFNLVANLIFCGIGSLGSIVLALVFGTMLDSRAAEVFDHPSGFRRKRPPRRPPSARPPPRPPPADFHKDPAG